MAHNHCVKRFLLLGLWCTQAIAITLGRESMPLAQGWQHGESSTWPHRRHEHRQLAADPPSLGEGLLTRATNRNSTLAYFKKTDSSALIKMNISSVALSHSCMSLHRPPGRPRVCARMSFFNYDISAAKRKPYKCFIDKFPGVKARLCTLCEGLNCTRLYKVVDALEKSCKKTVKNVISLLQNAHTVQEHLYQNYNSLEDAFSSLSSPRIHLKLCGNLRQSGLCHKEIENLFPGDGLTDLLFKVVDHDNNNMISGGELRAFFQAVFIFSHMAAPVVQSGKPLKLLKEFPIEGVKAWLKWDSGPW